jgi:hypothetical protein
MGFPLDLATNSTDIIAAADWLWKKFPATAESAGARPARMRIVVEDRAARMPPVASMPRGRDHLISMVHGPDNFAVCDLAASFTFACLTRDVARNSAYVRYHFLEPAGYMMIDASYLSPVHASCAALNGQAVLLCGDSGAGKTSLAYACAQRGWTYLSDDATHIVRGRKDRKVVGRPFRIRFRESARHLFPELKRFKPELRPNGKMDIEVDTDKLGIPVALAGHASHIVFLNRCPGSGDALITPVARNTAKRRLRNPALYGMQSVRGNQKRAIEQLLHLPAAELTYHDFDSAERTLRALLADSREAAFGTRGASRVFHAIAGATGVPYAD